ncbi:redox-sensitive transcriptional activator SoxR [Bdellovibrio sp. GT3]|uniref:redox-sensitive transcriptional activator SoxR n=1 Tax=Bdellovibrio sp. GT3 TaxID=3136282 RepID=UPI0030F1E478
MKNNDSVASILSIGELSKRSGVAVTAIHFYESKGLIYSARNEGNQRRFPRGMLRILAIIKASQNLGFSLEEIKQGLAILPTDRAPTQREWKTLATKWRIQIEARLEALTNLRDHLDTCIGCGCLSIDACPIRNGNDKLAKKGPGAHLLK